MAEYKRGDLNVARAGLEERSTATNFLVKRLWLVRINCMMRSWRLKLLFVLEAKGEVRL